MTVQGITLTLALSAKKITWTSSSGEKLKNRK